MNMTLQDVIRVKESKENGTCLAANPFDLFDLFEESLCHSLLPALRADRA